MFASTDFSNPFICVTESFFNRTSISVKAAVLSLMAVSVNKKVTSPEPLCKKYCSETKSLRHFIPEKHSGERDPVAFEPPKITLVLSIPTVCSIASHSECSIPTESLYL